MQGTTKPRGTKPREKTERDAQRDAKLQQTGPSAIVLPFSPCERAPARRGEPTCLCPVCFPMGAAAFLRFSSFRASSAVRVTRARLSAAGVSGGAGTKRVRPSDKAADGEPSLRVTCTHSRCLRVCAAGMLLADITSHRLSLRTARPASVSILRRRLSGRLRPTAAACRGHLACAELSCARGVFADSRQQRALPDDKSLVVNGNRRKRQRDNGGSPLQTVRKPSPICTCTHTPLAFTRTHSHAHATPT